MTTTMADESIIKGPRENHREYWDRLRALREEITQALNTLHSDAVRAGRDRGLSLAATAHAMGISEQWLYSQGSATGADVHLSTELPQRGDYDDTLAYYADLRDLRVEIRARMPEVLLAAVEEGDAEGVSRTQIAAELGVTRGWLYKQLPPSDPPGRGATRVPPPS